MIDHCISALKERSDAKIFRVYVTDALRIITENTANLSKGQYLKARYVEAIDRTPPPPEDPRSCEEIVTDIWQRAGIGRQHNVTSGH